MPPPLTVCPPKPPVRRSRAWRNNPAVRHGCGSNAVIRKGYFARTFKGPGTKTTAPLRVQRFQRYKCKACGVFFSERTLADDYRQRNTVVNDILESFLMSGISQRRAALLLKLGREPVARRISFFAVMARRCQAQFLATLGPRLTLQFDEMRTFEHTKMKPIFMPIVVDEDTKCILGMGVARAPADGPLAERSRKKYGFRPNEKSKARQELLRRLQSVVGENGFVKSDEEVSYPKEVAMVFLKREHIRFKGRKACVVGQGELKAGGWDPLFALNHAAAMARDNLKRLSRRTWCTTKRLEVLRNLLDVYVWFHNGELLSRRRPNQEKRRP